MTGQGGHAGSGLRTGSEEERNNQIKDYEKARWKPTIFRSNFKI